MKNQVFDGGLALGKFQNPHLTAKGEDRAFVALTKPEMLWFNTGTLCNIECGNCYIESSPSNDRLVYITADEVSAYLDQINERGWPVRRIGFTGGEPFMNPDILEMTGKCLAHGFEVLILTNALRPMMRKPMQTGLKRLHTVYGEKLVLRISLDHWSMERHDKERGRGNFARAIEGMKWLREAGIRMAVAGRTIWGETDAEARAGYAALYRKYGFEIDARDLEATVLFPEMDEEKEAPEITTACWASLNKSPDSVMCASSRMVVKRKGAAGPTILACTLLPYKPEFELGSTLAEAERNVFLNHPRCAQFCVLGGASCSA